MSSRPEERSGLALAEGFPFVISSSAKIWFSYCQGIPLCHLDLRRDLPQRWIRDSLFFISNSAEIWFSYCQGIFLCHLDLRRDLAQRWIRDFILSSRNLLKSGFSIARGFYFVISTSGEIWFRAGQWILVLM